MGHIHLGRLPRTRDWQAVVAALESGAGICTVAALSAKAAETSLLGASGDPVFVEVTRLLVSIPHAAKETDFARALRRAGLIVPNAPTLHDILGAIERCLDLVPTTGRGRTDLGELAARGLLATISDVVGRDLPGLFSPTSEDLRLSFRKFAASGGMAVLSRAYFGNIVSASLSYWLDRTLSDQIGKGGQFGSIAYKSEFDRRLHLHAHEATRIIQEFSGGFVSKHMHDKGEFNVFSARDFGHICLKKIVEELRERRDQDA